MAVVPHIGINSKPIVDGIVKALTHVAVVAPITMPLFLGGTAFLKRFKLKDAMKNIRERIKKLVAAAVLYQPIVNFVGYYFIPFHMRQLHFDFANFLFGIFQSYINN